MKTRSVILSLALYALYALFPHSSRADHEVGFIEKFALAADRGAVLKELIPGTEEFYFFTALHLQNTGNAKELAEVLTQWSKRNEGSPLLQEIRNRQALVNYDTDPKATLAYLKQQLGVEFNHAQQTLNPKPDLPTSLDPKLISTKVFLEHTLQDPNQLGNVTDAGIEFLLRSKTPLSAPQRRQLLSRVQRPDLPGVVELIIEEMKSRESRQFGEFPIHAKLLVSQLQALKESRPELMTSVPFVHTWLGKLQPGADVNLDRDAKAREAWLDQAYGFAKDLPPVFNTLKAHLLYQRLVHDQEIGKRNAERFLAYLKLPRHAVYVSQKYLLNEEIFRHPVDLNADLRPVIGYLPIGDDHPLVRSYLLAFLVDADNTNTYAPYIDDGYLKHVFAEAKLTSGKGDAEKWFSLISPGAVQQLRDRVDLDFDPANPKIFDLSEAVSLDLHVKNVPKLTVSTFEINTLNFYRSNNAQIGTDLNLDGLVANDQQTAEYAEAPIQRVKRTFAFPQLKDKRGVWIVDFIGNGKSSRALIRKGQLHLITRPSSAGTALTILDEALKPLPKATALVAGQEFKADEEGEIILPFSNKPGSQPVILTDGAGFAQLEQLVLQGERYGLSAGFHVPHESLVSGKKATVVIRPTLTVNGAPVDIKLLEHVVLSVRSTNMDGVQSTVTKPEFKLTADQEPTFEFTVPERLSQLSFVLEAKLKSLLTGEKVPLTASHNVTVNTLDKSDATSDYFLSRVGDDYILQQLGRTGEPRSEQPCSLSFFRNEFGHSPNVQLKTDVSGAINLGELAGISRLQINDRVQWELPRDQFAPPSNLHIADGESITLPWMEADEPPTGMLVSLLELRRGVFVRDVLTERIASVKSGYLILKNLEPGDYSLRYGSVPKEATIRVTKGKPASNFLIGETRTLEVKPYSGIQIIGVVREKETLSIGVGGAGEDCRVHVFASRFLPTFNAFGEIGDAPGLEPLIGTPSSFRSVFISGRSLGEEYRYVIDRRSMKKFPGSLLPRPGLLLNPWAIRDTQTEIDEAAAGTEFQRRSEAQTAKAKAAMKNGRAKPANGERPWNRISNMDFLATTGPVMYGLKPDKGGKISIKLADLGDRQFIRILALDGDSAVQRDLSLADAKTLVRDLSLRNGLDPKAHFTRQNEATILEKDAPYLIKDAVTTQFELSSDLGNVFTLFDTLSHNATLQEFRFLLDWPKLAAAKKTELYSKYASHELSFFLHRKDPAFFKAVILPYLANKRSKTFMDHYLLGENLTQYLSAWNYGRLNVVERILLAQRHPEQAAATARDVKDLVDIIPPNPTKEMGYFDTLLGGSALQGGAGGRFGLPAARSKPEEFQLLSKSSASEVAVTADAPAVAFGAPLVMKAQMEKEAAKADYVDALGERAGEGEGNGKRGDSLVPKQRALGRDEKAREQRQQQFYRKQPPTQEWAENNYYRLPIEQQLEELVIANAFWRDYAAWDGKKPFLSTHVAEASGSFTEMLCALAVLDLPFPSDAKEPKSEVKDLSLTLTPTSRALLFHREIKPAAIDKNAPKLLVSQNFYRHGDRYIQEGNEKRDKFVTEEFLTGIVYGCQIVVTNPTSSNQALDLLLQIPQGAIPVLGSKATNNVPLRLESYRTHTQDYFFYFPKAGTFPHHPVHVSKSEKVVAFAEPFTFTVVNELTKQDTKSWDYISQFGKSDEVLAFLDQQNLRALDLGKMAWRMRDKEFYGSAIKLLASRHVYDQVLWSYSLLHNDTASLREFLLHSDFPDTCGPMLVSKLLNIDPIARHAHQHLEYSPLVNARAHRLGGPATILNGEFHQQYTRLLQILIRQAALGQEDHLAVTYYLLLQDRVEEALAAFAKVDATKINEKLQYDYLRAVLACYQEDAATARKIATARIKESVDKWREKFAEVLAQLDEIDGKKPAGVKEDDRNQQINKLATAEPALDFTVESKEVRLKFRNVKEAVVNYYPMDLEFLFSTAPFVSGDTKRFGMIQPNKTERIVLPADKESHTLALPKEYHSSNVLVEIVSAGKSIAHAYYANELNIVLSESQGMLQVLHAADNRPLAKTYVKVFAEINGQPKFYKDGYTDLRGKFDYLSLSTGQLDNATKFGILILSDQHGAAVKEAKPPQQ